MARKRDEAYARALGPRIKRAREDAKLVQEDIAKACGVSTQAVHYWELGKSAAPTPDLITIARITRCDFEWLVSGKSSAKFGSLHTPGGTAVPRVDLADLENLDRARHLATNFAMAKKPVGPNAFSLVVPDNANAPQIKKGDECVFDPDADPEPEKFVVALIGKDRTPVIRVYYERSDHVALVPANKAHKEYIIRSAKDGEIIATLVEFTRTDVSAVS